MCFRNTNIPRLDQLHWNHFLQSSSMTKTQSHDWRHSAETNKDTCTPYLCLLTSRSNFVSSPPLSNSQFIKNFFYPFKIWLAGRSQSAAATGRGLSSSSRLTHSTHRLIPPTQLQPDPSVGGGAAQDQSLRLGTHTQPAWAHGSGALLLFPSPTHTRASNPHTVSQMIFRAPL